jgi:hypothetical protein
MSTMITAVILNVLVFKSWNEVALISNLHYPLYFLQKIGWYFISVSTRSLMQTQLVLLGNFAGKFWLPMFYMAGINHFLDKKMGLDIRYT